MPEDLLTFEVSTPNNELITFAKASNQQEKDIGNLYLSSR